MKPGIRFLLVGLWLLLAVTVMPAQSAPPDRPAAQATPEAAVRWEPDSYEADNTADAAWNIGVGELQQHTIQPAVDEDWVRFAPPDLQGTYTLRVQDGRLPLTIELWVIRSLGDEMRLAQRWRLPAGGSQEVVLTPDAGADQYRIRIVGQQRLDQGSYVIAVDPTVVGDVDTIGEAPAPTATATPTSTPTATPPPTPTVCVDNATFVTDVTVPDGTIVTPGQRIDKVWRLRNSGNCRWGAGYSAAFVSGNQMSGPATVPLAETPPGGTVDVAVALIAPSTPGTHTGYWQLRNAAGALFGSKFSVQVTVPSPAVSISFTADRTDVPAGQCATLRWDVDDVSAVYLGDEGVVGHGSRQVCPGATTTYTLRVVRRDGGTEQRQVTITVTAAPAAPSINFRADKTKLNAGECTTLRWDVDNVKEVYINGQGVPGHGAQQVCPGSTTNYDMHVVYAGGTTDRRVTIEVASAGPSVVNADIAVVGLYADNLPVGAIWVQVTNYGPGTLSNATIELKCNSIGTPLGNWQPWSHIESPWLHTVSLQPGDTATFQTQMTVDTTQYSYEARCAATPPSQGATFTDPDWNNNVFSTGIGP
jgi:hypothetical protein